MLPPPLPPGLNFDFTGVDLSNLQGIKDLQVLNNLLLSGKISSVDYAHALCRPSPEPFQPRPLHIIYPESSNSIVSPATVLESLRSPLRRSNQKTGSIQVHRISDTLLVKSGALDDVLEAKTMLFVQQRTKIPVPTIHLVFTSGEKSYIVMDYLHGGDLQHLWPTLQPAERQSVLGQISKYLRELRSISPASQVPGPVGGGVVCDDRWFASAGAGPFVMQQQMVDWWNARLPKGTSGSAATPTEVLHADQPLVFTHGDLLPRNLILSSGIVWVVDWGLAGWYPPYFEYACIAQDTGDMFDPTPADWAPAVLPLLPDYRRELRLLRSVIPRLDVLRTS